MVLHGFLPFDNRFWIFRRGSFNLVNQTEKSQRQLDYLVIGDCILDKSKQDPNLKKDYTKEFELD